LLPKVLIVGGEDVHARIDLMRGLTDGYRPAAAGASRELGPTFARCGFPYYYYPLGRGVDLFSDLYAIGALWRLIRRVRPTLVHAFDTKPGVYACLAARFANVPVVVGTVTGLGSLYGEDTGSTSIVRGIYEVLQRLASRHTDLTIFQNPDDRQEFVARRVVAAGKSTIIPGSGVPTSLLDPARFSADDRRKARAELGVPGDALLVTMVSRVIRSKGVEEFVAAAGKVRQHLDGSHFLLVGPADKDSVDAFRPEELAGFARHVNWCGPRQNIPAILAASDLFVLPSYLREGIPRVLLEAASMGLPIITTDSPGCAEVVEEGVNGMRTPMRDPAALAQAISHLLVRPELRERFGRQSRQRAVERFDLSVIVKQTRNLYQELLARKDSDSSSRRVSCSVPGNEAPAGPVPTASRNPMTRKRDAIKRLLDVVLSATALVVTGPFILLGALAVKLTSRGPAFYRAKRAGLGGRPFSMFKLRTMRVGTDTADRKITDSVDNRVTGVGRWLRKFKIDELSQFWNVLRGDMAIVGPRPEDWDIVEQHYTPQQRRTLEVRPGIASPVDVLWYPDLTYHDPPPPGVSVQEHYLKRHLPVQLAESFRYVKQQSLLLDFQVICKLVYCVLVRSWLPPRRQPLPSVEK
jgi:lipopolysaccharide/colanic/teichoic acid biosynthesis glycosyltransferase/glycosyltransferase involved in cell wall biosynthesis